MEKLFENLGSVKKPKLPGELPHKWGLQCTIWTPKCNGRHADAHWVLAYGHKTQSLMKNGGQQKCLDKALLSHTCHTWPPEMIANWFYLFFEDFTRSFLACSKQSLVNVFDKMLSIILVVNVCYYLSHELSYFCLLIGCYLFWNNNFFLQES